MTTVFYTNLDAPLAPDLFDYCLNHLGMETQQKILKLVRHQDQHASLMGKMLLLKGLLQFGYPRASLKKILYDEYKRPFINLNIDFNISHSGELIVCALSDKGKVGVDVEEIRSVKIEDFKDVLSISEYNKVVISKDRDNQFFNTWTKKEAVVKANGKGLYIPLTDIILENGTAMLYNKTWYLKEILFFKNYSSFIATENQLAEEEPILNYVNKEDLKG